MGYRDLAVKLQDSSWAGSWLLFFLSLAFRKTLWMLLFSQEYPQLSALLFSWLMSMLPILTQNLLRDSSVDSWITSDLSVIELLQACLYMSHYIYNLCHFLISFSPNGLLNSRTVTYFCFNNIAFLHSCLFYTIEEYNYDKKWMTNIIEKHNDCILI